MRLRFAYSSTLSFGRRCRAWPQPNTKWYNHYFKSNRVPHSTLHDNNKYTKTKADILVFAAIDSSRRLPVLCSLFPRFDIWCSLNSQWLWLWLCISVCSLLFHCCWLHSSHCYVTVRGNAHFMHTKYFFLLCFAWIFQKDLFVFVLLFVVVVRLPLSFSIVFS